MNFFNNKSKEVGKHGMSVSARTRLTRLFMGVWWRGKEPRQLDWAKTQTCSRHRHVHVGGAHTQGTTFPPSRVRLFISGPVSEPNRPLRLWLIPLHPSRFFFFLNSIWASKVLTICVTFFKNKIIVLLIFCIKLLTRWAGALGKNERN